MIPMRKFLLLAVLVLGPVVHARAAEPVQTGRPNIVFIMADDME
jgi:hypothetical protein